MKQFTEEKAREHFYCHEIYRKLAEGNHGAAWSYLWEKIAYEMLAYPPETARAYA